MTAKVNQLVFKQVILNIYKSISLELQKTLTKRFISIINTIVAQSPVWVKFVDLFWVSQWI